MLALLCSLCGLRGGGLGSGKLVAGLFITGTARRQVSKKQPRQSKEQREQKEQDSGESAARHRQDSGAPAGAPRPDRPVLACVIPRHVLPPFGLPIAVRTARLADGAPAVLLPAAGTARDAATGAAGSSDRVVQRTGLAVGIGDVASQAGTARATQPVTWLLDGPPAQ